MTLIPFFALLFAHLIADYPLQSDFIAQFKGKNNIILAVHAGIWTGVILVAVHLLGYEVTLFDIASLFVVHAIADYCKARGVGFYRRLDALGSGLLIDQGIHVLQIVILILYKGMY